MTQDRAVPAVREELCRLRPFELGALLRWEKSRVSQHLGRMEKRGLVTR